MKLSGALQLKLVCLTYTGNGALMRAGREQFASARGGHARGWSGYTAGRLGETAGKERH